MDQLNPSDRKLLEGILLKGPTELTEYDIAVLNARRSYLTYAQRQVYKGLIVDDLPEVPVAPEGPTKFEEATPSEAKVEEPVTGEQTVASVEPATPSEANPYDADPSTLV